MSYQGVGDETCCSYWHPPPSATPNWEITRELELGTSEPDSMGITLQVEVRHLIPKLYDLHRLLINASRVKQQHL